MQIIKPMTLGLLHKTYGFKQKQYCVVSPVVFFELNPVNNTAIQPSEILPEQTQWPLIQGELGAIPFDLVMPKPQPEYLLAGTAYNPAFLDHNVAQAGPLNKKLSVSQFQAQVNLFNRHGSPLHSKTLNVLGEREWQKQLLGYKASPAQAVTQVPLDLQHSFGGKGLLGNPEGMGFYQDKKQQPLGLAPIESPQEPVTSIRQKPPSAGFGALPITHPTRAQYNGDYTSSEWLEKHFPDLAPDTDFLLFQAARKDQLLTQPLVGDECYQLVNLHADYPCLQGQLPAIRPRAFVHQTHPDAAKHLDLPEFIEVSLNADTLWFFPNQQIGALIYRGQLPCSDPDALDINSIVLGYENTVDAPKSQAHYFKVLKERQDPETALLVAMDESLLTPCKSDAQKAQEAKEQDEEALAKWEIQKEQQAALLEDVKNANNGTLPKEFEGLEAPEKPEVLISSAAIARGDFNLKALKAAADEKVTQAKAQQAALKAQQQQQQAQIDGLKKQALTSMAQVNHANNQKTKPFQLKEGIKAIEWIKTSLPYPEVKTQNAPQLEQLAALEEKANQYRMTAQSPWPEYTIAQEKRAALIAALNSGASLAHQDWSGADLSNLDLSKQDLTGCNLENCTLENTRFVASLLNKASFVGAKIIQSDFSHASLNESNFSDCIGFSNLFEQAQLKKAFLLKSVLPMSRFMGANLQHAQIIEADLSHSQFSQALLSQSCFMTAQLTDTDFQHCEAEMLTIVKCQADLSRWTHARLTRCAFLETSLVLSQFAQTTLVKCQFSGGTELPASQWAKSRLQECGLRRINGQGIKAEFALFYQCDFGESRLVQGAFEQTEFVQCVLSDADLSQSQLIKANFYRALMRKTQLSGCNLHNSNFFEADALLAKVQHASYEQALNVPALTLRRWHHAKSHAA